MTLSHIAGVPVEEALAAVPAVLAVGAATVALLRARLGQLGAASSRRRRRRAA